MKVEIFRRLKILQVSFSVTSVFVDISVSYEGLVKNEACVSRKVLTSAVHHFAK